MQKTLYKETMWEKKPKAHHQQLLCSVQLTLIAKLIQTIRHTELYKTLDSGIPGRKRVITGENAKNDVTRLTL